MRPKLRANFQQPVGLSRSGQKGTEVEEVLRGNEGISCSEGTVPLQMAHFAPGLQEESWGMALWSSIWRAWGPDLWGWKSEKPN